MTACTLVLAPRAMLGALAGAGAVAGSGVGGGTRVVAVRPVADGPRADPYRLRTRAGELIAAAERTHELPGSIDHLLLVVPRRRGVAASTPGVVVDGCGRQVAVGVVFADHVAQLPSWLVGTSGQRDDAPPSIVVGAMGTNRFLDAAGRWIDRLNAAGLPCVDRRACHTDRAGFADALAQGPSVAVYLGHGNHDALGGYQELRYEHLSTQRCGIGVLLALACSTLAQPSGQAGFGRRLVADGRARTVIGAVRPCRIDDLIALGDALVEQLLVSPGRAHGGVAAGAGPGGRSSARSALDGGLSIGGALVAIRSAAGFGQQPELLRALGALRIVGDPASPIGVPLGVHAAA